MITLRQKELLRKRAHSISGLQRVTVQKVRSADQLTAFWFDVIQSQGPAAGGDCQLIPVRQVIARSCVRGRIVPWSHRLKLKT